MSKSKYESILNQFKFQSIRLSGRFINWLGSHPFSSRLIPSHPFSSLPSNLITPQDPPSFESTRHPPIGPSSIPSSSIAMDAEPKTPATNYPASPVHQLLRNASPVPSQEFFPIAIPDSPVDPSLPATVLFEIGHFDDFEGA